MDARLIPVVLPTAKKVVQLESFKAELKRVEAWLHSNEYEDVDANPKIFRYQKRLVENINKLEKELGYENANSGSL